MGRGRGTHDAGGAGREALAERNQRIHAVLHQARGQLPPLLIARQQRETKQQCRETPAGAVSWPEQRRLPVQLRS